MSAFLYFNQNVLKAEKLNILQQGRWHKVGLAFSFFGNLNQLLYRFLCEYGDATILLVSHITANDGYIS